MYTFFIHSLFGSGTQITRMLFFVAVRMVVIVIKLHFLKWREDCVLGFGSCQIIANMRLLTLEEHWHESQHE